MHGCSATSPVDAAAVIADRSDAAHGGAAPVHE
jgi:hypothetical protein